MLESIILAELSFCSGRIVAAAKGLPGEHEHRKRLEELASEVQQITLELAMETRIRQPPPPAKPARASGVPLKGIPPN